MTTPLKCPNCDEPVTREDEHEEYNETIDCMDFTCTPHDWRAEALASRDAYARGFKDAIESAAKVADEIEAEEGAAFICGDTSATVARSASAAIRALTPTRAVKP